MLNGHGEIEDCQVAPGLIIAACLRACGQG